jgi:hypothetical protein
MASTLTALSTEILGYITGYPLLTAFLTAYFGNAHPTLVWWTTRILASFIALQTIPIGVEYIGQPNLNRSNELRQRVVSLLRLHVFRQQ